MFKSIRFASSAAAVNVICVPADASRLPQQLSRLADSTRRALSEALRTPGFKADPGEVVPAGSKWLLLGLGKRSDLKADVLRTIGARLVKRLDRMNITAVRLMVASSLPARTVDSQTAARSLAEGLVLGNWRVDLFDGTAGRRDKPRPALRVACDDGGLKRSFQCGLEVGESQNYARRLGATPPNICNPRWIAQEARRMARAVGLRCRVIDHTRAREMGMGGLTNVGMGSASKPCLVILEHKPPRSVKGVKLVIVGKTITYDTGGYSLKISNGMKGMKYDKCGGMAVLGTMRALARLKIPVHVVALLPAAENMVSERAYRPDDIINMYNGVSVEVTNTDAEGRLVLADALAYACDKLRPTAILDIATLTGGVVVALGSYCSGVWCNDDDLRNRLDDASDTSGEKIWRLPLWPEHREFMRAKHADVWNSGPKRDAHPIQGAAFLSYFVDSEIPWAHVDMAGVMSVDGDTDLCAQGPTGYGVRLLTEWVSGYA